MISSIQAAVAEFKTGCMSLDAFEGLLATAIEGYAKDKLEQERQSPDARPFFGAVCYVRTGRDDARRILSFFKNGDYGLNWVALAADDAARSYSHFFSRAHGIEPRAC